MVGRGHSPCVAEPSVTRGTRTGQNDPREEVFQCASSMRARMSSPSSKRPAVGEAAIMSDASATTPSGSSSRLKRPGLVGAVTLDLGLDRDNPLTALEAIRDGEEIDIDYGLAGDRPFLNNVSFGIYAEAVHRPEYRESKEETIAAVIRDMQADGSSGATIRFATPQGEQTEQTALTLVSNNPYVYSGPPDYGRRTRLDAGVMGITTIARGTDACRCRNEGRDAIGRPRNLCSNRTTRFWPDSTARH